MKRILPVVIVLVAASAMATGMLCSSGGARELGEQALEAVGGLDALKRAPMEFMTSIPDVTKGFIFIIIKKPVFP